MASTTYSPLRYPGGKQKIAKLVNLIIQKADIKDCVYIEPFAGGAGIALNLLLSGQVSEIVINDFDRAIASFWKAILNETDNFLTLIEQTPITIEEWHKQKEIYSKSTRYSLEYGFATFFLNRTNHSGILSSGPIGGFAQKNSQWTMDVRYNKTDLISRIQAIAAKKEKIHCYNKDILSFVDHYLPLYQERGFVYFDPPYFYNGRRLYKNFFTPEYHRIVAQKIFTDVNCDWIVSYDDVPEVLELYSDFPKKHFSLSYSLANKGEGREVMFFKKAQLCPSTEELNEANIKFSVWE